MLNDKCVEERFPELFPLFCFKPACYDVQQKLHIADPFKCKVERMVSEYRRATFWLTLSAGDYDDEELYRYQREINADLLGIKTMTPSSAEIQPWPGLICRPSLTPS